MNSVSSREGQHIRTGEVISVAHFCIQSTQKEFFSISILNFNFISNYEIKGITVLC